MELRASIIGILTGGLHAALIMFSWDRADVVHIGPRAMSWGRLTGYLAYPLLRWDQSPVFSYVPFGFLVLANSVCWGLVAFVIAKVALARSGRRQ